MSIVSQVGLSLSIPLAIFFLRKFFAMNLEHFAARLRDLRKAAGLSQKELAEKTGLSQNGISNWESAIREPSWGAVQQLAAALGVTCEAFADGPAAAAATDKGKGKATKGKGK
jgi:transcriptional regulator with XRE-family HTH domain